MVAALALCSALSATAYADFFSTSPGPLAKVHEKIDNKDHCTDCHINGRQVAPDKCLKCHEAIAARIKERKGVHASAKALGKPASMPMHVDVVPKKRKPREEEEDDEE